ncbi:hypothetical protein DP939_09650 [Spongiactinospora rosea]|uniref:histidine kinase n=1 Tax=Spongiactinospora rosea TaxID=2248750 RepID=A0A366M3B9_9ACTN|nr:sensor histidine kinase [Spongiactinospora rosea]RBQ20079.1 hypothetical protein DP939_09650 [Spongiactinospora rosea]
MRPTVRVSGRDRLLDAVMALSAAALGIATVFSSPPVMPSSKVMLIVNVVLAGALLLRRRAPLALLWIAAVATVVIFTVDQAAPGVLIAHGPGLDAGSTIPPITPFAAYTALAQGGRRRAAPPVALLILFAAAPWESISLHRLIPSLSQAAVFVAGPALLGMYVYARQRLLRSLIERADRAERERHLLAERARAEERARLAADMHDIVSHRVTLMVLQAGALRVTADNERIRAAAESLRTTGCQALEELHDMIGLLRATATPGEGGCRRDGETEDVNEDASDGGDGSGDDEGGRASQDRERPIPVPDVRPLIAESESVGVPIELVEEGDAGLASQVVARTAYRVVQEALTNARKHAPGAKVRVLLRHRRQWVDVSVRNTEPTCPGDAELVATGGGMGLIGLRRRVELVGGTLRNGPTSDGGYEVEASLPTWGSLGEWSEAQGAAGET